MESSTIIAIMSTGIAVFALVVSIIALWRSHLRPFQPLTLAGDLELRVYPVHGGPPKGWYITSFRSHISVSNGGARPGRVMAARLVATYPTLPIEHRELFRAVFQVDPAGRADAGEEGLRHGVVVGHWTPFVVLPGQTVSQHVLFENRWDKPVIQDRIRLVLELLTDASSEWLHVTEWEHVIDEWAWSQLMAGASFTMPARDLQERLETRVQPHWIHKYTGPRDGAAEYVASRLGESEEGCPPVYSEFLKEVEAKRSSD